MFEVGRNRAQAGMREPARRMVRVVRVKGLMRVVLVLLVLVVGIYSASISTLSDEKVGNFAKSRLSSHVRVVPL